MSNKISNKKKIITRNLIAGNINTCDTTVNNVLLNSVCYTNNSRKKPRKNLGDFDLDDYREMDFYLNNE